MVSERDGKPGTQADQPWTTGPTPEGKANFSIYINQPLGPVPDLGFGRPDTFGQKEQAIGTVAGAKEKLKDLGERAKDALS